MRRHNLRRRCSQYALDVNIQKSLGEREGDAESKEAAEERLAGDSASGVGVEEVVEIGHVSPLLY
jgi:hypothetical protein